jgi:hypothetical protein
MPALLQLSPFTLRRKRENLNDIRDGETIPVESKEDNGNGDVPVKVENPADTAAWILLQLNLLNEGNGKVKRVTLRKSLAGDSV